MNLTNKARSLRKNQTDVEQLLWKHLRDRHLPRPVNYAGDTTPGIGEVESHLEQRSNAMQERLPGDSVTRHF